jgi:hypothetical protein
VAFPTAGGTVTLTIRVNTGPATIGALTEYPGHDSEGNLTAATITFYPNATFPNTSTRAFVSTAPGWNTIFQKLALHEIGHTMGMKDVDISNVCGQADAASVMNGVCGVNDGVNNMPTNVANCDNNVVSANPVYGGTGGGGGGGGCVPPPGGCGGAWT